MPNCKIHLYGQPPWIHQLQSEATQLSVPAECWSKMPVVCCISLVLTSLLSAKLQINPFYSPPGRLSHTAVFICPYCTLCIWFSFIISQRSTNAGIKVPLCLYLTYNCTQYLSHTYDQLDLSILTVIFQVNLG